MNPQETQVAIHDEKWVPSAERVKINSTNIILETTVPQKEETVQVQFRYTIKKVQNTDSYKFLLANKKYVLDDDTALTFLIDLGYKDLLNRHTNMFVDHMHQPWRTLAAIINKCLSGKTASNDKLKKSRIDILWGMFNRENVDYPELIWEDFAYQIDHRKEKRSRRKDYQEYGLLITDVMLTDAIKRSESYRMFIKYSTNQIPPKKRKGKAKKITSSKRRVKKKFTLSADDNIISNDPDAALELAKSISQTKAKEAEATRKVHDTHAWIVTKSVPESAKNKSGNRNSKSVFIQDTLTIPKLKPVTSKTKLKGASSLTPQEQEAADIMQALKESKKTSKRQPGTRGSNKGAGSKPGVPNESTVIFATSSERTSAKPRVPDEEKDITKEKVILDDTQDADDKTESDKDEIYKYKIRVRNDDDVEMKDVEVEESNKGEEKVTDVAKEEAEKTSEVKDDAKKTKHPPSSSSLSVSSGFSDQFLKLSSDSSLVHTVKDSSYTDVSYVLDIPSNKKLLRPISTTVLSPQVTLIISTMKQTPTPIPTPQITTDSPTIIIAIHKSDALSIVELRLEKLEKDVLELKTIDHFSEALVIKKEQAKKQKKPQFTIKSTDKAALQEYDLTSALYQSMHANKSSNRNFVNHRLYHALIEALIEDENAMDKEVADTVKDHKRKHDDDEDDDDEDPPARPNQGKKTKRRRAKESESSKKPSTTKETAKGKTLTKGSKTGKSALAKEPVKELIVEDPLIFNDLIATPIDFCKYVLNGLKIENLTQDILLGHAFNLLKGTCSSSIKLDYNFQECFNVLTNKLDWNNPEGDRYLFDLSKPLPLQEVTYTTSIMKTKASRYEINGIKDMVPTLWSTIKHAYDKDAKKGIKHWGKRRKLWYRSQVSKFSKQNVYSTKEILGVKSVSVKKLHGYGHLEEIVMKRSYQHLYKFKEGIVYEDLDKQKRALRADKMYKFSDSTLKSVRDEIRHKVLNFRLDYSKEMQKRKWTAVD
nr:hypothetical protein [Tanacetum cinerariifolium]